MILGSGLGIALSLVFGCLLLALIAELYYLIWWKKLRIDNTTQTNPEPDLLSTKELFHFFCWTKPTNPSSAGAGIRRREGNPEPEPDPVDVEAGPTKDAAVEAELLRLQNRLLFTIKEETKEDLESEDGRSKASRKGSRTRSLSDLVLTSNPLDCYSSHGYNNPLFESSSILEAEMSRIKSSPPPKFKFLRDAEEKLYKRLVEEAEKIGKYEEEERELRNGSFIRIIVGKNNGCCSHFNYHSSSSQVTPLASSPTSLISSSVHSKPTT